jgi:cytochrome b subunit of formate dehydrogenase/mono/diheme cytochrome c family protein
VATQTQKMPGEIARGQYQRFDVLQRIEHLILLVSFSLLGATGLPQKFAASPIADAVIQFFGGIEMTRQIHHVNAIIMILLSAYHVVAVGYRVFVLRGRMTMLPTSSDLAEWWQDTRYKLGLVKRPAKFGRYNYGEKMEYWAMVWGTIIMTITGFMLWNPISTARLVPGEWIPAAKAAHGAEAILAVLAVIIWHFYNVHLKTFNKSMFTGKLDEHQMAHEHGRELEAIARGATGRKIDPPVLRLRQRIYFPIATVVGLILALGVYRFATLENTVSIKTVPPAVNVPILLTATPQPTPTRAPTPVSTTAPTKTPGAATASGASFADVQAMLKAKCGTCHGDAATAGLNVTTYATLMKGGADGPVVIAKDAADSLIVKKMEAGGHPGQLSQEELAVLKAWIDAGATGQGGPGAGGGAAPTASGSPTFVKDIQPLFHAKCAACHGTMGGLTLTSFESLMHGGTSGPAITPKDPDKSLIVTKQAAGGHPGQFTPEELELVRRWIAAGAPEQ